MLNTIGFYRSHYDDVATWANMRSRKLGPHLDGVQLSQGQRAEGKGPKIPAGDNLQASWWLC